MNTAEKVDSFCNRVHFSCRIKVKVKSIQDERITRIERWLVWD